MSSIGTACTVTGAVIEAVLIGAVLRSAVRDRSLLRVPASMCRGLVMRTPQTEKVEWPPLRCRRPPSIALPAVSLVMPFQNSALAPRLCLHTNELFNDLCWCEMQVGDAIEWALRLGDIPGGYSRLRAVDVIHNAVEQTSC